MTIRHSRRRGFTLIEGVVAAFLVSIIAIAGIYAYGSARISAIKEWQEQNALYLAEREVESWQAAGYVAQIGWTSADVTSAAAPSASTFLPYGYSVNTVAPGWNSAARYKPVTLDNYNYRVRAQMLYTVAQGNDFFIQDTYAVGTGSVVSQYRQIRVIVQWGAFSGTSSEDSLVVETRIGR